MPSTVCLNDKHGVVIICKRVNIEYELFMSVCLHVPLVTHLHEIMTSMDVP
jgi:hypothetical protein